MTSRYPMSSALQWCLLQPISSQIISASGFSFSAIIFSENRGLFSTKIFLTDVRATKIGEKIENV